MKNANRPNRPEDVASSPTRRFPSFQKIQEPFRNDTLDAPWQQRYDHLVASLERVLKETGIRCGVAAFDLESDSPEVVVGALINNKQGAVGTPPSCCSSFSRR